MSLTPDQIEEAISELTGLLLNKANRESVNRTLREMETEISTVSASAQQMMQVLQALRNRLDAISRDYDSRG